MDKEIEALEEIGNIDLGDNPYKKFEANKLKNVYNKEFAILYNAIAELKAIKEANPSEAIGELETLKELIDEFVKLSKNKIIIRAFDDIKQALLKAQEDKVIADFIREHYKLSNDINKNYLELKKPITEEESNKFKENL